MAAGNNMMVPLREEKAQVPSDLVLHNGNFLRQRDAAEGPRFDNR